jgi:hypothetical protein
MVFSVMVGVAIAVMVMTLVIAMIVTFMITVVVAVVFGMARVWWWRRAATCKEGWHCKRGNKDKKKT